VHAAAVTIATGVTAENAAEVLHGAEPAAISAMRALSRRPISEAVAGKPSGDFARNRQSSPQGFVTAEPDS
ncbi:hypothetical protein, partial [Saccharopolyspora sp. NPDC050642]|uniref:hypothetical protein n=1 Tax=Saccharopolyspora sp. NPDC050642 TaxID=3157099 RepID=UPI0033E2F0E4